ncbi:MAG: hypothetical protein IKJ34_04340 [Mailhella sp.]|nr:hypothetical protein [Mailhella sp.]
MSQIHLQSPASTMASDKLDGSSAVRSASSSLAADADMVSRFDMLMNAPHASQHGEHDIPTADIMGKTQQHTVDNVACGKPDASALFLMHSSFGPLFAEHVDTVAGAATISDIDLEMLVERILVSASTNGTQEVRLTISGDHLKGTEIVIQRDVLGALTVQFHAHDAAAFQTLVAAQGDLRQILEVRTSTPVTIMVDNGNESGNDAERRSRGHFQQDSYEA